MKTVKLFSLLIFVAVAMSGCRGSEPFDKITRAGSPEAFNYVVQPMARTSGQVYDDAGYYIVFDDENKVATVTIANLRVPGNETPRTLTFKDVPMDYTRNNHQVERMIVADRLVSQDPVNRGTAITDVTIVYTQSNDLDANHTDGIYARFTVDDAYVVTAYPYAIFADGTTRVDDLSDMTTLYDYTATYDLHLDPTTMTARMTVKDIEIGGTATDIEFSGLGLDLTDNGYRISFDEKSKIDSDMEISVIEFNAEAGLRTELDLDFIVELANGGKYRVTAFLTPDLSK